MLHYWYLIGIFNILHQPFCVNVFYSHCASTQALTTMASCYLHVFCAFFTCFILQFAYQDPLDQTESCYPKGSVACKMWNDTNMDCSLRDLLCIPPLRHASSIELLDLSRNNFSIIPDFVFHNLGELQHLDLSNSHISTLQDGAFLDYKNSWVWICHWTLFPTYKKKYLAALTNFRI